MKLGALAAGAGLPLASGGDTPVTGFAIDHRKVAPGTVFGAFQGTRVNGEDFIPAAIEGGAVAVVARPEARVEGAVHFADAQPRRAFARLAAQFFTPVPETANVRSAARATLGITADNAVTNRSERSARIRPPLATSQWSQTRCVRA